MMDDGSDLSDGLLGNLAASGSIENVVHLPMSAELLVLSNETSDDLDPMKSLNLSPQTLLNVGGNYLVTSLKNNGLDNDDNNNSISGKYMSLENGKNTTVTLLDPPPKRQKTEDEDALKKMLLSVQHSILERLESIEKKVEKITTKCQCLEEKVENMIVTQNACVLNDPKGRFDLTNAFTLEAAGEGGIYSPLSSLNTEATYPNGSWLGNPENEAFRVRCPISPKDLVSINETCNTPVKMALTLLDYLFDRETQACSNISGAGKHGKLQLDPVKIFGIRCHLMYMFGVTELQWRRIKLNLDSKCRSAFRRKQKGMPLTVKGFREKPNNEVVQDVSGKNEDPNTSDALALLNELGVPQTQPSHTILQITDAEALADAVDIPPPEDPGNIEFSDIIHTDHGDIHVIHATLEQLVQLKESTQVEILTVASGTSQT